MTREEKIKGLYSLKEYLVENPIYLEGYRSLPITLIDYAIEALEQETVSKESYDHEYFLRKEFDFKAWKLERQLDKVRAEIEAQEKWLAEAGYNAYNVDVAFFAIKRALEK